MSEFFFSANPLPVGPHVAPLQRALLVLLERGGLLKDDDRARRELEAALHREMAAQVIGDATRKLLSLFQEKRRLSISGILDDLTAAALNRILAELLGLPNDERAFVVRGEVKFADGFPAAGVNVIALDLDFRSEEELGRATTGKDGKYEIRYSPKQFRKGEKGSADLRVRAEGSGGAELASSAIFFNAPADVTIDLTIEPSVAVGPVQYERIRIALAPVLDKVSPDQLEEEDLAFLEGEIGVAKANLARYALAHRLARKELPAEFWFALLGSVFTYASGRSLREQLTTVGERFSSIDSTALRRALERAFTLKEIPETLRAQTESWSEAFARFAANQAVAGDRPTVIKQIVDNAKLSGEKGETLARLFTELKSAPAVLDAIENDKRFKKREVADLRTTFRIAGITGSDFALAQVIKDEFGVREPSQLPSLARRTEDEWSRLLLDAEKTGRFKPPATMPDLPGLDTPPANRMYAQLLTQQFRDAFPTAAFAGGLERALKNGGSRGLRQPEKLMRFLDKHQDFELATTHIDTLDDVAKDEDFRLELKAVQRVYKLAPTYEATDALLADNVHSAQQIYRMGESEFVRTYKDRDGFTTESARVTWNRAADIHGATISLVGNLKALEAETLPQALKLNDAALAEFPNWENLFKTGDVCECEHCRSVLSPAAYFTDLLLFLRDRKPTNGLPSVKDVLLQRRPDLGYIELNCENALTPFPYIDTVNEVLEAVVANGADDVQLNGFNAMPAANPEAAVQAAFDAVNPKILVGDFTLSQVAPADPNRWVVHGPEATYLLKKKPPAADFFAQILRNTKATADELRAYPQYVSTAAYNTLKTQKHPLGLPFDLFGEEVRASLGKVNLQRWELMQFLRQAANNPSDLEIAAEYFGIGVAPAADPTDELRLILGLPGPPTVAEQQVIWGENAADWLDRVGNVKRFLDKTGLEYNDLLALLDLEFINPAGDIAVHHDDPTCDTAAKWIRVLDEVKLDRIHRFLRLWRKLPKWKLWELDLVVRRIGGGVLNGAFLVQLFYFNRLRKRLGEKITVEQLTALFAPLETESRFTKLHEKREDAIYQRLFMNKRLVNPVDRDFTIDPPTGDVAAGFTISGKQAVVQAALGLQEADLKALRDLTKASDGLAYILDVLNVGNLSFLWRHAWLSKLLKLKPDEWQILLDLFDQDIAVFANPQAAWEFVEKIDRVKAAGLKADALSWILAADRNAKSATKETDAIRFLGALRKELQAIEAEHDPAQYDFLTAAPPTDEAQLSTLLATLLGKLNRDETATTFFTKVMSGRVVLEAGVEGMPAGFVFDAAITGAPNHIPIEYIEPAKLLRVTGVLTDAQRAVLLNLPVPAAVTGLAAYGEALDSLVDQSATIGDRFATSQVTVNLAGGVLLPAAMPSLPISYNAAATRLSFTGLMTNAERLALIAAGNPAAAIDELFAIPRLAVKFFDPTFTTPLASLPPAIDFKAQLAPELAAKISYDSERRTLRFAGIMTLAEQAALHALVPVVPANAAFHAAVDDLALQPQALGAGDPGVWLSDNDLDAAVPANDTVAKRLANAITKALTYLSDTLAANRVILDSAAALGLTEAMTRRLMTGFAVMPPIAPDPAQVDLLTHLTRVFAPTGGAIDYTSQKTTFDGWYWAQRAAALLKHWKLTLPEWERVLQLTAGAAQLFDFGTLPLDSAAQQADVDEYLNTSRLLRLRDTFPERALTFLELLVNLDNGGYANPAGLAADVEKVTEWRAKDVEDFVTAVDLIFPIDYAEVGTWERMRRTFAFVDALNAGPGVIKRFAAAIMTRTDARIMAELLRSKFGTETWLTLAAEIQDILRERKRDALVAYLLTRPMPVDAPSGKWENTNDLYAYYLLDVEMSSCQLTSRLVQGSGSIQLFVQRCFMGLEPDVEVISEGDDGDSAWRWWKWMRKYRVWEANRKVFLWPENWIEPELRKDRSQFFKDLETDLLQNEINQRNAETAFASYLDKLDGVAQLEIAGFFQEDDADQTILHVFGRTRGAEPHVYYYRRFDFTQWSPWEKVDLDIQGDYLIPAVVNRRLFLFWPVFTEVPDEQGNTTMKVPKPPTTDNATFTPDKTKKILRMQMAVSEYRDAKWTPRRISKDHAETWNSYTQEIVQKHYLFFPVDRTSIDGQFGIRFDGFSAAKDGSKIAQLSGSFELASCKGAPERGDIDADFLYAVRPERAAVGEYDTDTVFAKWLERSTRTDHQNDFALEELFTVIRDRTVVPILIQTPWLFRISPPWHMSYMDRLFLDGASILHQFIERIQTPLGTWLPFFYADKQRTFLALPAVGNFLRGSSDNAPQGRYLYYPEVKGFFRFLENLVEGSLREAFKDADLTVISGDARKNLDTFLHNTFPNEAPPPFDNPPAYTEEESDRVVELFIRYFMRYVHYWLAALSFQLLPYRQWHFKNFYHPFVCDFAKLVHDPLKGIPGLMDRRTQLRSTPMRFATTYQPTPYVIEQGTDAYYPKEIVDFDPDGSYAPYNWELFFHAPLLIANSLSRNQRFEEAREWYHFIFNPLGVASPQPGASPMSKYWITKPFFEITDPQYVAQRIDAILRMLAGDTSGPATAARSELEKQVLDWRRNPFEPHRIANYRRVAYQKTTVMKYLDNLIAWGDNLFRQDSIESTNEATQLYILAAEILGPRPRRIPPQVKPPLESFNELELQLDDFANALVEVENVIPPMSGSGSSGDPAPIPTLYFCIPQNDKLLGYWDTVADRLYKLRHCMNIEGVVRQLALFEPPIDPGALVKAVAGGIDISSAIADLNAPLPLYRFTGTLQKANEVCNDLKALGGALLSALEKKDAEELARLRQSHELKLLDAVRSLRETQLDEAKKNVEAMENQKKTTEVRRNYYRDLERMTSQERLHLDKMRESQILQEAAQGVKLAASIISILPAIDLGASGFGGTPIAKFKLGGLELGQAASLASDVLGFLSLIATNSAAMASAKATYDRRADDWNYQVRLADKELIQLDTQIEAAKIRVTAATKELENQKLQIENSKEIDAYYRSKYTNEELYQWQIGQISGVFFQTYRLAYDLAKRAERCFRFELGLKDSSYINFGYWDSLHKGLLSGEKLQYDLRRLESAYMEQNRRELELTKNVSLAVLDPLALLRLRETGRCFVRLPEEVFDLDFPGHYFRRIKSVSMTIPCVTGPYTTIACTVRLLKNSIRANTSMPNQYEREVDDQGLPTTDDRFVENNIPIKAIATSTAQNDSGMFELTFRDERYLPFEGAGAISEWGIELFNDGSDPDFGEPLRQFDYSTISDVVLHVRYTAREDAGPFKTAAIGHLRDYYELDNTTPATLMLNLRSDFPTQWHRFLHPTAPGDGNVLELEMSHALFPFRDRDKTVKINAMYLLARCTDAGPYTVVLTPPLAAPNDTFTLVPSTQFGGMHFAQKPTAVEIDPDNPPVLWRLAMVSPDGDNLVPNPTEVEELFLVLGYEWN